MPPPPDVAPDGSPVEMLDDDRLIAEAAVADLQFDAWLDPARKWARFVARQNVGDYPQ